ncbi:MAG: hypothetical protein ABS79_00765 [Planctomycetes bacterium SCN 63-9]|nr:MAG: hypothetical protein ABS79_00765 [Planctomycetes bacterium SCN 63-9]
MTDPLKSKKFSRTSIGRNRWFWIVIEDWFEEPIAQGISRTTTEAWETAARQCGELSQATATLAKSYWVKQRAIRRQQASAKGEDAQPIEFAYRCYRDYSDFDSREYEVIERHRIVRRTRKLIFVEKDAYDRSLRQSGEWWDYDRPTFVLDRLEFEASGKASRSTGGWWDRTYYSDPVIYHAERRLVSRLPCFEALGLPADATAAQVRAAYRRLSRACHPDAGGIDSDFVRLTENYEEAMRISAVRV